MKAPSGELIFWAVLLLGGAVFVVTRLPTTAAEFQVISLVLAACLVADAVLLLVRFRWSPEIFVAIFMFLMGWGVVRGVADGFTGSRIGLIVTSASVFFAYPTLRREVRERAPPTS